MMTYAFLTFIVFIGVFDSYSIVVNKSTLIDRGLLPLSALW